MQKWHVRNCILFFPDWLSYFCRVHDTVLLPKQQSQHPLQHAWVLELLSVDIISLGHLLRPCYRLCIRHYSKHFRSLFLGVFTAVHLSQCIITRLGHMRNWDLERRTTFLDQMADKWVEIASVTLEPRVPNFYSSLSSKGKNIVRGRYINREVSSKTKWQVSCTFLGSSLIHILYGSDFIVLS